MVLAEAYDADSGLPSARIVNVSVRNHVGTADNQLVVGVTWNGTPGIAAAVASMGAFPLSPASRDSALPQVLGTRFIAFVYVAEPRLTLRQGLMRTA